MSTHRPNRRCRMCHMPKIPASHFDKGTRRCKDCIAGAPPTVRPPVPAADPSFWVGLTRAQLSAAIAARVAARNREQVSTFARTWPPPPGAFVSRTEGV